MSARTENRVQIRMAGDVLDLVHDLAKRGLAHAGDDDRVGALELLEYSQALDTFEVAAGKVESTAEIIDLALERRRRRARAEHPAGGRA